MREDTITRCALRGNPMLIGLQAYHNLLAEKHYFDYSSIIDQAVTSIRTNTPLRNRLASRLKAIIVDEYQDVNPIQEQLVLQLHSLGAEVKVVGDDDQTIYQWRGSDVNNILTFHDRYSPVRTIRLEENFRSSAGITDVARLVIQKNTIRLRKEMRSAGTQAYEVEDIVALDFPSPRAEAEYIAKTC